MAIQSHRYLESLHYFNACDISLVISGCNPNFENKQGVSDVLFDKHECRVDCKSTSANVIFDLLCSVCVVHFKQSNLGIVSSLSLVDSWYTTTYLRRHNGFGTCRQICAKPSTTVMVLGCAYRTKKPVTKIIYNIAWLQQLKKFGSKGMAHWLLDYPLISLSLSQWQRSI